MTKVREGLCEVMFEQRLSEAPEQEDSWGKRSGRDEDGAGVCRTASRPGRPCQSTNPLGTHVHRPSLSACNHQSAFLCKRRNSSHTDQQSPWGPLLEVMKQPKSWEGLRGQRELALIPALPLRRDLFLSPSVPRVPRNQCSPSNKCTHSPLPELAYTVQRGEQGLSVASFILQ